MPLLKDNALVVEDSKSFNAAVTYELEKFDLIVDQAYSFEQANQLLSENEYNYMFVDLGLPDGRGEDIVLQQHFGIESKIVVFTGESHVQMRETMFTHGILDYFTKRDNYEITLNEIRKLMEELIQNPAISILVIDDSKSQLAMVEAIYQKRNYTVLTATSGKEGLEILNNNHIDLIILDLEMPEMNGEQLLEKIRSDEQTLKTPVIILSGTENMDMVARVLKSGADDFIKKPFLVEELVLKSRVSLRLSKALKELKSYNKQMEQKVISEVNSRQEKERLLVRQSKMAAMGELIGNIAHQWRQPLNTLNLVISKIAFKMEHDKLSKEDFNQSHEKMKKIISKMSSTIDDFRNYFKPDKEKKAFLISNCVEQALDIIGPTLDSCDITVEREVNCHKEVLGYPNEFSQVIMVLLGNAKDAIIAYQGENKTIYISCEEVDEKAILTVQDSGGGIPEDVMPNIFDPYYTTKDPEEGTGIGLFMSKQIVEESMEGKILVENNGSGAIFKIELPL